MELLQLDRDKVCDFYMEEAKKRIEKVNAKLPLKDIKIGDLVMKYVAYWILHFKQSLETSGLIPTK